MIPVEQAALEIERIARVVRDRILAGSLDPTIVGETADGDILTAADRVASKTVLEEFQRSSLPCRILIEEEGQFRDLAPDPEWWAIVDELDGSRPARLRIPLCSVCIALVPAHVPPTLGNIVCAVICTLDGHSYGAIRGQGVTKDGRPWRPPTSPRATIQDAVVILENAGDDFLLAGLYHAPFAQARKNGVHIFSSSSYAARCLVEGLADLHTHLAMRQYADWPELSSYLTDKKGNTKGMFPYDLAAYSLVLQEADCTVTDSHGRTLDDVYLGDISPSNQRCVISSRSGELHKWAVEQIAKAASFSRGRKEQVVEFVQALSRN